MPCIRCGKITVKLCTCSIDAAKQALSTWSELELKQAMRMLVEGGLGLQAQAISLLQGPAERGGLRTAGRIT